MTYVRGKRGITSAAMYEEHDSFMEWRGPFNPAENRELMRKYLLGPRGVKKKSRR